MSQTFDEGGAKGLLLVNLGVGQRGCNIVFDSKEEDEEIRTTLDFSNEGMIDISNLISKLDSVLGNDRIESLDLVPQLQTLRQEYAILEDEGYITHTEKRVSMIFVYRTDVNTSKLILNPKYSPGDMRHLSKRRKKQSNRFIKIFWNEAEHQ
jgi:Condensin complex subunit 2